MVAKDSGFLVPRILMKLQWQFPKQGAKYMWGRNNNNTTLNYFVERPKIRVRRGTDGLKLRLSERGKSCYIAETIGDRVLL